MAVVETVFSEYDVRTLNFILGADAAKEVYHVRCVGKLEEESEVRSMTKKCRGVVAKKRTWGTGTGTLKLTAHMPYELYVKLHGMASDKLADGVHGYGKDSKHPEVLVTADVFDEDDVEKLKAWPVCVVGTGPARSVENGAEEVAETELEIGFSPDAEGFGMYEALKDAVTAEIAAAWLESFDSELVKTQTV